MLTQKYRVVWLKEGDRNSKLLHALYKAKINKSLITELQVEDGQILTEQSTIRQALSDAYNQRFQEKPMDADESLFENLEVMFSKENNIGLSEIPKEQEIEEVAFLMNPIAHMGLRGTVRPFIKVVGL